MRIVARPCWHGFGDASAGPPNVEMIHRSSLAENPFLRLLSRQRKDLNQASQHRKKYFQMGHVAYRIRALLASIRDLTMSNYCLQPIIPPTYEKTSRRLVSSNIGHRIESYD